ncbi:MAG: hypothetical protein KDC53_04705 [Saprospiraceae bacterium]|nr:hypothetical protein [Saprospiraceae bacterium]
MSERKLKLWLIIAFISFLFTAMLGGVLRYAFVVGLPDGIQFRYLQHAHSHVGMMGWLYSALYIFILILFDLKRKIYFHLFWITQIAVAGMLLSFPVQGYAAVSIFFTTLHLMASYIFIIQVFRDLKKKYNRPSYTMLKTSLVLLFISTLGTWALGAIMNSPLKGSAWYYDAIQFFLHFQFNGWFIFGIIALFLKYLENRGVAIEEKKFKLFYRSLLISCFLTFSLALTWSTPTWALFVLNSIGVVLQIFALYYFFRILRECHQQIKKFIKTPAYKLWKFTFYLLTLKIVMQSLVAIPKLAIVSYTIRNFVIGFIHLLMLGIVSLFLIGLVRQFRKDEGTLEKFGVSLFLIGFVSTEVALFTQGLLLWIGQGFLQGYYEFIFIASLMFPVSILIYLTDLVKTKANIFEL